MSLVSNNRLASPSACELEVSLFGPGYGECVVLHIGGGHWIIVDSCIDASTRQPAALTYLHEIGVPPSAVCQIIATHWHDDHVRGLAQVVEACPNADFVLSDLLTEHELLQLVCCYLRTPGTGAGSGVSELGKALDYLRVCQRTPSVAMADKRLMQKAVVTGPSSVQAEVWALSPSSYDIIRGKVTLKALLPTGGPMRRVPAPQRNDASVAVQILVDGFGILLGADLENSLHPQSGWNAVLMSTARPQDKSSVFKVPHHGAASADAPGLWNALLTGNPVTVLTPWRLGGEALPTAADRTRLAGRTAHLYATANPDNMPTSGAKRAAPVARTIRDTTLTFRAAHPPMGQVRVRIPLDGDRTNPTVELFGSACRLGTADTQP